MKHYDSDYPVWDFVEDLNLNFYEGNIIKYLARYTRKDGIKDLKKAGDYAERLILAHKAEKLQKHNYTNIHSKEIERFLKTEYFNHSQGKVAVLAISNLLNGDIEECLSWITYLTVPNTVSE